MFYIHKAHLISIVKVFDDQTPSEIYDSLVFFTNKVENSQQHVICFTCKEQS